MKTIAIKIITMENNYQNVKLLLLNINNSIYSHRFLPIREADEAGVIPDKLVVCVNLLSYRLTHLERRVLSSDAISVRGYK